jgi:hypothetical protein
MNTSHRMSIVDSLPLTRALAIWQQCPEPIRAKALPNCLTVVKSFETGRIGYQLFVVV